MTNTTKDLSGNQENNNLESIINGATVVGDLHHNSVPLEEAFIHAQKRGNKIIYNGDWVGDYNIIDLVNQAGYELSQQIVNNFMQDNLSKDDYTAFSIIQEIQGVGGIEQYLGLIQQQNNFDEDTMKQVNQELMGVVQYSQNDIFQKNMESLESRFHEEKSETLIENSEKIDVFYQVLLQEQGLDLANMLNKYNIDFYFNEGNHDSKGFIEQYVRPHLENKDQVTVLNDQVGYVDVNGLNVAGITNSDRRILGSVRMALSPELVHNLFPHVEYGINEKVLLQGKKSKEDILNLESIIKDDAEYNRMTNNGKDLEEKTLDILATHAPLGQGQGYSAVAAYLALNSSLHIESDTHKNKEGKNMFGGNMINTGTRMVDVYKDEQGIVRYESVNFVNEYDSFEGYTNPNINYLKQRTEKLYKQLKEYQALEGNNSSSGSDYFQSA